jgi:hypothetical protein
MRYAQNDPIDCRNAEGKSRLLYKISANLPDGIDTVALALGMSASASSSRTRIN